MRLRMGLATSGAVAILAGCAGEPRILEPRTRPDPQMPAVALPPTLPPANQGRVVLDTTDGPMRITMQNDPTFRPPGTPPTGARTGELCITPCVVDLPLGRYRLFMTNVQGDPRGDSDDLEVTEGTTFYRRAPGTYTTPTIADGIAPATIALLGAVAIGVGGVLLASQTGSHDQDNHSVEGGLLLGVGIAALIGGGIWVYDASRARQQDGATTSWRQPFPH